MNESAKLVLANLSGRTDNSAVFATGGKQTKKTLVIGMFVLGSNMSGTVPCSGAE